MADNTVLPGVGETYAADDIDGVKFQRVKLSLGEPGEATDASATTPFPITSLIGEAVLAEILLEMKEISRGLRVINGEER